MNENIDMKIREILEESLRKSCDCFCHDQPTILDPIDHYIFF
jgi:hypothetical protein